MSINNESRGIVFFDVDNTIFCGFTQKKFAAYVFSKKILKPFDMAAVVVWFILYKLKIIRNEERAINFLLAKFKGWRRDDLENLFAGYHAAVVAPNIYSQAAAIIKEHLNAGRRVILLSTSLEPIVRRIAAAVGITEYLATKISFENNICQGRVDGRVVNAGRKLEYLRRVLSGGESADSFYYADHYSDIPLLSSVSHPLTVNPDASLRRLAAKNHWPILNFSL